MDSAVSMPRRPAWLALALGLAGVAAATAMLLAHVGFAPTWFYLLVWYPTLLALDGAVALTARRAGSGEAAGGERSAGFALLGRPAYTFSLLAWSTAFWLLFELLNFRLDNWYYVFLPADAAARWAGILLSFATVIPAVLVAEALLANLGIASRTHWRALRLGRRGLRVLRAVGLLMLLLAMVWPRWFFPLVWGFTTLLLEPFVREHAPERSLLADLENGRPGRLIRLLLAGIAVGLLWELYNSGARGRWIYTVPGFEHWKLFEMPVLGFLGFAPFAVDCYVAWQALVVAGLAAPRLPRREPGRGDDGRLGRVARLAFVATAVVLSALVIGGMERYTITSYEPDLAGIPGAPAGTLRAAGYDVFTLAKARPADVARRADAPPDSAARWIEDARLATLRGIGTRQMDRLRVAGVTSVRALADAPADTLEARLASAGDTVPASHVRVWVRAARAAMREGSPPAAESSPSPPFNGSR